MKPTNQYLEAQYTPDAIMKETAEQLTILAKSDKGYMVKTSEGKRIMRYVQENEMIFI